MSLIYIVEDEPIMADCIAAAILGVAEDSVEVSVFNDGVSAMQAVNERIPDVILLDIMLTGPNGFAFLNEMISYPDTAKVPIIIISSLDLSQHNLEHYGIKQILDKAKMTPEDIYAAIQKALAAKAESALATAIADTEPDVTNQAEVVPQALPAPEVKPDPAPESTLQSSDAPISLDDFKARLAASPDNTKEDQTLHAE